MMHTMPCASANADAQGVHAVNSEFMSRVLVELSAIKAGIEELRERERNKYKLHYTVEEVAERVCRSSYTVRRWIKEKMIHAERVHGTGPKGRLLIPREEIEKLISLGLGKNLACNPT